MALPSKTFATFVSDMVASWAASLGFQPTLQAGDALYATMQAVAAQLVFVQAQVQLVNAVARAQTSTGADLDTFMAQFGFTRLPGAAAIGPVVLSKKTPAASPVLIPPGAVVQTVGGAIQYQIVGDTAQPTWSASQNAYVLATGQSSLTATAQALATGSAYNVAVGQLSQLGTPLAGIDAVTNIVPIADGSDPESDTSFRARFVLFINSLSKATYGAIVNAVASVPGVVDFTPTENINVAGAPQPGEFVVAVDDGTGSPPASLLAAVQAAVNAVRGFTILGQVVAISDLVATIATSVRLVSPLPSGLTAQIVEANVAAAIVAAVNALAIGATCFVAATIEDAALNVNGVASVQPGTTTLNGLNADLVPTALQGVRTDVNHVTVGTY